MKMRLTDNLVKALKSPDDRDYLTTHDEEITGFGVRVTRAGTKSFVLNYRAGRRERRLTIGKLPDWSVKAAREQAKTLRRQVDLGDDPMASRHADRAATRVFELAERYQREHASKKRPSSQRNDALNIKNHIVPRIGQLAVKDVTFSDIDRLHQSMQSTPYQANRVLALLSHMFSMACTKWEIRADNPCKGVAKFAEHGRETYLKEHQISALMMALDEHSNQNSANAVRLLLLTGARSGEILSARWEHFDLERGLWEKPSSHTKQKRRHIVPLSSTALDLLRGKAAHGTGEWLFPGDNGAHQKACGSSGQPCEARRGCQERCASTTCGTPSLPSPPRGGSRSAWLAIYLAIPNHRRRSDMRIFLTAL